MTLTWHALLIDQLAWHWDHQLRPRLGQLTDEEYRWEPVDGCWSIRPRAEARTSVVGGAGDLVAEFELPEPVPAPVTTIAWRLGHVSIGCFGVRNADHFGAERVDYFSVVWPDSAAAAVADLDDRYATWMKNVTALDADGLARPIGEAEGPWADQPMAALIQHINREVIHHLAEVCLLQDLHRAKFTR